MERGFAVIGLGYVGLPVALALAKQFEPVIGFDISKRRIAALRDAEPVKNNRQLVHQRDVEVALGVLDDLCRLGDLERGRPVDPGLDNASINAGYPLQGLLVLAGNNLDDRLQPVLLVAGVDPLG